MMTQFDDNGKGNDENKYNNPHKDNRNAHRNDHLKNN